MPSFAFKEVLGRYNNPGFLSLFNDLLFVIFYFCSARAELPMRHELWPLVQVIDLSTPLYAGNMFWHNIVLQRDLGEDPERWDILKACRRAKRLIPRLMVHAKLNTHSKNCKIG